MLPAVQDRQSRTSCCSKVCRQRLRLLRRFWYRALWRTGNVTVESHHHTVQDKFNVSHCVQLNCAHGRAEADKGGGPREEVCSRKAHNALALPVTAFMLSVFSKPRFAGRLCQSLSASHPRIGAMARHAGIQSDKPAGPGCEAFMNSLPLVP